MIHPSAQLVFINDLIGYGLIAGEDIPAGTVTYIKDDLEISINNTAYFKLNSSLKDHVDKYSFIDQHGNRILSWDNAKYVNHSCESNTLSTGWGFEIAVTDIPAGAEITDDYGLFNVEQPFNCLCSAQNCRGIICSNDMLTYGDYFDNRVISAMHRFQQVEQPLFPHFDNRTLSAVNTFINKNKRYKSVQSLYYSNLNAVIHSEQLVVA